MASAGNPVYALQSNTQFPKFNIPPLFLSYDKNMPSLRHVFTNIPLALNRTIEVERDLLREVRALQALCCAVRTVWCVVRTVHTLALYPTLVATQRKTKTDPSFS